MRIEDSTDEDLNIDELIPVQTESIVRLDWSNERSIYFQIQANNLHNFALGKIPEVETSLRSDPRKKLSRPQLKFADNIAQTYIVDSSLGGEII